MNKLDDHIVERIRKLLAMAADTSSPQEAAIAARRAEAMMRRYNIESADAILSDLKKEDSLVQQAAKGNVWRKKARSIPKWSQHIAVLCAELFDCHVVQNNSLTEGWHLTFLGYHTDVTVCVWTFTYLLDQCKRFADRYVEHNPTSSRSSRTAYHEGVAQGIKQGLREAKHAKELAERGNSTSTALVVAKRAAIEERFGKVDYRQRKARNVGDGWAWAQGLRDGASVNVNPGALGQTSPNSPQIKGN